MNNLNKGFTLIELLVVISIIGILSSVILSSLNTSRVKGADAAVKSNLNNMRGQAELYYSSNSETYGVWNAGAQGNCPTPAAPGTGLFSDPVILKAVASAFSSGGGLTPRCMTTGTAYAIAVALKSAGAWCIDSNGNSRSSGGTPTAAITASAGCN